MIELNEDQIYASYQAEDWYYNKPSKQIFEISGSAGTGKTTCLRYIIQKLGLELDQVLFVAYTGKAATQLCRNGVPARTIHATFYYYEKEFALDELGRKIKLPNGKYKKVGVFKKKDSLPKKIRLIAIDEATMVNNKFKEDIMSFGLPIIALGDMNQLPPVFGDSAFMLDPDVRLKKIMRQAENDPIVWIANRILDQKPLNPGVYGNSCIIRKKELDEYRFKNHDIVLTYTNRLRFAVNSLFRETFLNFPNLEYPYVGEKVICRKNNWDMCIGDGIYLTNGITGTLEYVDRASYNGKTIKVDFQPDFTKRQFRNIPVNYKRLIYNEDSDFDFMLDTFEFAYAITVSSSQGSQWDRVLALVEDYTGSEEFKKKLLYTQVTRASKVLTLAF